MIFMFTSTNSYIVAKNSKIFLWRLFTHKTWIKTYQPIVFSKDFKRFNYVHSLSWYVHCMQVLKRWEDGIWASGTIITRIYELPDMGVGNLIHFL